MILYLFDTLWQSLNFYSMVPGIRALICTETGDTAIAGSIYSNIFCVILDKIIFIYDHVRRVPSLKDCLNQQKLVRPLPFKNRTLVI